MYIFLNKQDIYIYARCNVIFPVKTKMKQSFSPFKTYLCENTCTSSVTISLK